MASGSIRPITVPPEARVSPDKLIDTQLSRVRRHIRITDLIAGVLVLLAGVVAFLTVAAVIDHWILGLGAVGRWLALGILLAGAAWHLTVNVVPLLLRRINPAYAAQTIERGEPTLKNSLLNYLLLRREKNGVAGLVYQAVQQRAAADVAHVQVDQTVDRSVLIRAGYVLAAIMAIAAAYKILSPKDPFQTYRRIASPWSDIARPARVTIESVEPGDAAMLQGQSLELSAIVRGAKTNEPVKAIFSSSDGQIIDRSVEMELDSAGLRHVATFPPDGSGLQQEVIYRITAGDAFTKDYRVRVSPAPMMTLESVEYEFPAYTQRERAVVDRQGDIKAVEGTRVTVRSRANQTIRSATIELGSPTSGAMIQKVEERLPMEFRDTSAWRTWTLELASNRQSSKYSAYQATFLNQAGIASKEPVTYRIEVVPDLTPEIEILTPTKETVRIPVHGEQKIEVRALDPDFGLTEVRLKATNAGKEILDEPLFQNSIGESGQIVREFKFRPSDYQLPAGSQITYWAVASDNRATETSPKPNIKRTSNRTLIVIEDPPRQDAKSGESIQDKKEDQQSPPTPKEPQSGDKSQQPEPNGKDNAQSKSKENQDKSDKSDSGQQGQQKSGNNSGSDQKSEKQSQEKGDAQSGGEPQSGDGENGNQQRGGNAGSNQPSTSQPGQGAKGQERGGTTPQQPNSGDSEQTSPGSDPNAAGDVREGNPSQSTEPVHDGEVFEKALERLKKERGEQPFEKKTQGSEATDPQSANNTQESGNKGQSSEGAGKQSATDSDAQGKQTSDDSSANEKTRGADAKQQDGSSSSPKESQTKGDEGDASKGSPEKANPNDRSAAKQTPADKQPTETKHSDDPKSPDEKAKGLPSEKGAGKQQNDSKEKDASSKQAGSNEGGPSGAGQKNDEKTGSGEKNTKGDKGLTQQPDQSASKPGDVAPPNQSDRPSDSKGQESGDRSGGGKKGAGQSSQQAGKDNAGSNSPSESGAGAANEAGKGEESSSPGTQQPAGTPTGSAGKTKGDGSKSKSDPEGKQSSPQSSSDPADQQPNQNKQGEPGKSGASGNAPTGTGTPTGGGQAADRPMGTAPKTEIEAGDDANLEYSRRATDMVLDYLKDQKNKPDEQLLDELGWTAEDLQRFLERWQKLKASATENPAARRELDETLRGLGLRRQTDTKRAGGSKSDDVRGLRESGLKSAPPSSYQEQFNAFKKGTARAQRK